ncbi:MAG: hypothetical protein WEC99_04970 [Halofilum sp. (in: g-proteobacteria)]
MERRAADRLSDGNGHALGSSPAMWMAWFDSDGSKVKIVEHERADE